MTKRELNKILKNLMSLLIFSFLIFIILVNVFKLLNYLLEVDRVIKNAVYVEGDINKIESEFNVEAEPTTDLDLSRAHTANELGYSDYLEKINTSEWGDGINILVVGSDKKDFTESRSRADVIIVLRINKYGQVLSLSIPRDTLIKVYDDSRWSGHHDKIGHSLYWGGFEGLKKSVEYLIGSPIYKSIIIDNFRAFEAFLAIVGGVSIDKQLEGKLGVQWIRNRQFRLGDVERCKRQQVFLKKSVGKLWRISNKGSIVFSSLFFEHFTKLIKSDLEKSDFYDILYLLKSNNFDPQEDFFTSVLPGNFGHYDSKIMGRKNLSCWKLNEKMLANIQFLYYSDPYSLGKVFHQREVRYSDFIKMELSEAIGNFKKRFKKKLI